MGLEVVVNEILARGNEEETSVLKQADQERQRLLDQAEGEADEIRARALQAARQRVDAMRREHESASEFEVRRRILTTQRQLTEDFRRRMLDALRNLGDQQRHDLLAPLVAKAHKDLPKGKIHARSDDMEFLSEASDYKKGRTIDAVGGFQVESTDGRVLLDSRFETLLERSWKDVLSQTKDLFEG